MSTRELIAQNIIEVLSDMEPPRPVLITREPFDIDKLAITQFPAVVVESGNEVREDIAMKGYRRGTIDFQIRGFVRSDSRNTHIISVDAKRNALIERLEEELNDDRMRGVDSAGEGFSVTTRVREITIQPRTPPLGEFLMVVEVRYNMRKGSV
tara:strand:- start:1704 stop:2162 length:459 start_codon:yes stop_codon:yes gene_type:complete